MSQVPLPDLANSPVVRIGEFESPLSGRKPDVIVHATPYPHWWGAQDLNLHRLTPKASALPS